ncbi:MAG: AMP-binding protein [Pseudomonas sp.]|uniref:AMP-binding protein n=1 Tax=Pseudomonas sp. TaxID=306 RepID=UPI0033993320
MNLPFSRVEQFVLAAAVEAPDRAAVIGVDQQLSYGELATLCEHYAGQLNGAGYRRSDRVLCALPATPSAIALLCALWRGGLVYVPVNPHLPPARLQALIESADPALLLNATGQPWSELSQRPCGSLIGTQLSVDSVPSRSRVEGPVLDSDLSHIIFTSGTTGQPKGIMMSHRAVLSFFHGMTASVPLGNEDRVGSIAPLHFDFSLLDLGMASGHGATLVQVPALLPHHPRAFLDYLRDKAVTQMQGVPSIWRTVIAQALDGLATLPRLRTLLYGGEAFSAEEINRLHRAHPTLRIINTFGQTESIACSFLALDLPLDEQGPGVPFGPAHPLAQLLLLDEQGHAVADGQTGEVYLRGSSLFSGYWRDPAATQARLVSNPLAPDHQELLLRSGDLAQCIGPGQYVFKGRRDLQVKIQGNRVEVEEIERLLCAHPDLTGACVVPVAGAQGLQLAAALVAKAGVDDNLLPRLREHLANNLPRYMLPSLFETLGALPVMASGKLDRRAVIQHFEACLDHPPTRNGLHEPDHAL